MPAPTSGRPALAGLPPQTVFDRDLDRFTTAFHKLGAVVTAPDGTRGIHPAKAPAGLISAYRNLLSFGAANGLLPQAPAGDHADQTAPGAESA